MSTQEAARRAAAVCAALLAVFGVAACSTGRDQDSYDYGYQKGSMGFTQDYADYSPEKACRGILKVFLALPTGKNIHADDAMDGCMDAVKNR